PPHPIPGGVRVVRLALTPGDHGDLMTGPHEPGNQIAADVPGPTDDNRPHGALPLLSPPESEPRPGVRSTQNPGNSRRRSSRVIAPPVSVTVAGVCSGAWRPATRRSHHSA